LKDLSIFIDFFCCGFVKTQSLYLELMRNMCFKCVMCKNLPKKDPCLEFNIILYRISFVHEHRTIECLLVARVMNAYNTHFLFTYKTITYL